MFGFRIRNWLVTVGIAFVCNLTGASDAPDQIDEKLLAQLQGEWDPISSISDGKPRDLDRERKPSIAIEGPFLFIRFQDQVVGKFEIKHLVMNDSLGNIDYEMREPRHENVRVKQLFRLDGEKLTTCVGTPPGGERPTELKSQLGSKRLLTVSQRRKQQ